MVSIEKLYKFARENLDAKDWEIESPLMKPYLAFYLFNNQLFTVLNRDGEILGFAVLARSYYVEDFLRGIGRGWYFINDFKYGDIGCIDLVCIKRGIGPDTAKEVSKAIAEMLKTYARDNGIIMGISTRLKNDKTFVRLYYEKGVSNGKGLWVCRTVRLLEREGDIIHFIEDILSTVERCRVQRREGIQSNI